MRLLKEKILSIYAIDDQYLILMRNGHKIRVKLLAKDFREAHTITTFAGNRGFILGEFSQSYLISIDNKLFSLRPKEKKVKLLYETKENNFFWHMTKSKDTIFIQEYGKPPTGIYCSQNLDNWKLLVTNLDIDRRSRHFHNVVWDSFDNKLIVTLGDGNLIRVAIYNGKWYSLYRGAWQFVPIVVLKDRIVLGMDSGIVRGGIGIYYKEEKKWEFIFLKWKGVKYAQMCDLKYFNGYWIAALGTPQAVLISKDLKSWYSIHIESYSPRFNGYMRVETSEDSIVACTGKSLVLLSKQELEEFFKKPIMVPYKAYIGRLRGLGFILKKIF